MIPIVLYLAAALRKVSISGLEIFHAAHQIRREVLPPLRVPEAGQVHRGAILLLQPVVQQVPVHAKQKPHDLQLLPPTLINRLLQQIIAILTIAAFVLIIREVPLLIRLLQVIHEVVIPLPVAVAGFLHQAVLLRAEEVVVLLPAETQTAVREIQAQVQEEQDANLLLSYNI